MIQQFQKEDAVKESSRIQGMGQPEERSCSHRSGTSPSSTKIHLCFPTQIFVSAFDRAEPDSLSSIPQIVTVGTIPTIWSGFLQLNTIHSGCQKCILRIPHPPVGINGFTTLLPVWQGRLHPEGLQPHRAEPHTLQSPG